jgi:flagellar biosynthesis/type III secretory pathway M-ring protein FliF/YscJ
MYVIIIFNSNIRVTNTKKYTTLQPRLLVIHLLLVGVLIVGLIIFSQVFTPIPAAIASEMKDTEFEDKAIKQELEPMETEEIGEDADDNKAKQDVEGEDEEQQSNDDTARTGLEEDIMIDDNYSYDDDVPIELPFDNSMPFP